MRTTPTPPNPDAKPPPGHDDNHRNHHQHKCASTSQGQNYTPTWIRSIDQVPVVVTAEDCTVASSNSCTATANTICPWISFCGDGTPVLLKTNATTGALPSGGKCTYQTCSNIS